ncbi:unnamed protein product [Arabis nemorensis]|uniref:Uncharacterized protein n=1 Tax=Arabis nemorensis TaxID=586526 RepID=A0A565CT41_9BRAS|nr:unnamed protein product [Arabis nemorensis]
MDRFMIKDHETQVMEDIIKNQVLLFVDKEIENCRSAITRIEKYREDRKQVERNLDQGQVAQALATYLSAVRRQQRTNQEDKIRQEKSRSEAATNVQAAESALRLEKHGSKKL